MKINTKLTVNKISKTLKNNMKKINNQYKSTSKFDRILQNQLMLEEFYKKNKNNISDDVLVDLYDKYENLEKSMIHFLDSILYSTLITVINAFSIGHFANDVVSNKISDSELLATFINVIIVFFISVAICLFFLKKFKFLHDQYEITSVNEYHINLIKKEIDERFHKQKNKTIKTINQKEKEKINQRKKIRNK